MPRASNPDVPPPPPGVSSGYDEVFEMEEDTKSPQEETTAQKQVRFLESRDYLISSIIVSYLT